jgi:hypothetical protein
MPLPQGDILTWMAAGIVPGNDMCRRVPTANAEQMRRSREAEEKAYEEAEQAAAAAEAAAAEAEAEAEAKASKAAAAYVTKEGAGNADAHKYPRASNRGAAKHPGGGRPK